MSQRGPVDISVETARLLGEVRDALRRQGPGDWRLPDILDRIQEAAAGQATFKPVADTVRLALEQTRYLETALTEALETLEKLEVQRVRFSAGWWTERREEIRRALQQNPLAGFEPWVRTFAEALVAWEFGVREELLKHTLPLPGEYAGLPELFAEAIESVREARYADPRVFEMLTCLLSQPGVSFPALDDGLRAALLVFRGRIHLHDMGNPDSALTDFEAARRLAPQDPLPIAALGGHRWVLGDRRGAEGYFQQAVLIAPDQPYGHLGFGLCAEDGEEWDSAREYFGRAAELVRSTRDPVAAFGRLRSPASGLAYLCLGELLQSEEPDIALAALEKALAVGVRGAGRYPERVAHRLKADVLGSLGREEEAARAYVEAAEGFHWDGQSRMAEELLLKARELASERPDIGWELADVYLVLSYEVSDKKEKSEHIHAGIRTWDENARHAFPADAYYWAYLTRARLAEQEASMIEAGDWRRRAELFGQAITFVERSLILKEDRALSWALLARYYREFLLQRNELAASERAMKIDRLHSNDQVIEERIIALANAHDILEAESLLEGRFDPEHNPWSKCVLAYLRLHSGAYREAIRLAEEAEKDAEEEPELWQLVVLANALDLNGERERAIGVWRRAHERADSSESADLRGYAACKLGRYGEAIAALQPLAEDPFQRAAACRNLTLCNMLQGDWRTAEKYLAKSVEWSRASDLQDWLHEDLGPSWVRDRIPDDIYTRFEKRVKARLEVPPPTEEEEIRRAMGEFHTDGADESWVRIGLEASLARLAASAGRASEAAAIYQRLMSLQRGPGTELAPFKEGQRALRSQVDQLRAEADSKTQSGRTEDALEILETALYFAEAAGAADWVASLESRVGYVHFMRDRRAAAREHFAVALRTSQVNGAAVGEACRPLIDRPRRYFELRDDWEQWRKTIEPGLQSVLGDAIGSLSRYLDVRFRLGEGGELYPVATPIAIELSSNLIPEDTSLEAWPFLGIYIPELRTSLERDTGVRIPGIRVRQGDDSLLPDSFIVLVNEVPLVMEHVPASDSSDPMRGVAYRLGEILRRNLSDFLGLEETGNLISQWQEDTETNALIQATLPNLATRILFTRVLRALVRELVPVKRPRELLEAVQETGLSDHPGACVDAVRLRLRDLLPGNEPNALRLRLPEELEEAMAIWMWADRDRWFLAAPPEEVQEWLAQLSGLLQTGGATTETPDGSTVVVTRGAHLREPLRRVLELEFPHVMTLSEEELVERSEQQLGGGGTLA
jgi:tetratricopeptide (TPR) repeat protein